ncbi:hypothetical protein CHS0354_035461 [Potamilus streckersoni]|uniref:Uncharacterized protein n=1 Tax=Potamilus streckersoni TaxID=2493646 RepID=A0AAE0TDN3_9BIVA|nr:hypothetical protein CHS0354_035461 [Potamilus streckersoni]
MTENSYSRRTEVYASEKKRDRRRENNYRTGQPSDDKSSKYKPERQKTDISSEVNRRFNGRREIRNGDINTVRNGDNGDNDRKYRLRPNTAELRDTLKEEEQASTKSEFDTGEKYDQTKSQDGHLRQKARVAEDTAKLFKPIIEPTRYTADTTTSVIGVLPTQIQDVKDIVEDLAKPKIESRYFTRHGYTQVINDPHVDAIEYQLQHQLLKPEFDNSPENNWNDIGLMKHKFHHQPHSSNLDEVDNNHHHHRIPTTQQRSGQGRQQLPPSPPPPIVGIGV